MDSKLRPLADMVIVRPAEPASASPGGIIIPDVAKERPTRGTVLAVGPGRVLDNGRRCEPAIEVDHVVLYSRYAGTEIELGGKEARILKESDILAILE